MVWNRKKKKRKKNLFQYILQCFVNHSVQVSWAKEMTFNRLLPCPASQKLLVTCTQLVTKSVSHAQGTLFVFRRWQEIRFLQLTNIYQAKFYHAIFNSCVGLEKVDILDFYIFPSICLFWKLARVIFRLFDSWFGHSFLSHLVSASKFNSSFCVFSLSKTFQTSQQFSPKRYIMLFQSIAIRRDAVRVKDWQKLWGLSLAPLTWSLALLWSWLSEPSLLIVMIGGEKSPGCKCLSVPANLLWWGRTRPFTNAVVAPKEAFLNWFCYHYFLC